jgi:DNA-binding transcriptional regulator YdaS (Cro superfamily)
MSNPVDLAANALGSRRKLAEVLGVTPQAISKWRKRIPAERVLDVERATGVDRSKLRPDIYPVEGSA